MLKLTTWNVNSIRTRAPHVTDFLAAERPDLLLMQEIKCEAHQFPTDLFTQAGYHTGLVGQKSYNGVAILSRTPLTITATHLPNHADDGQARYLEITLQTPTDPITIGNLYLPNGNSNGDAGYQAKLTWMSNLHRHAKSLLDANQNLILAGDYNVCPTDADYAPGTLPPSDALIRPETRAAYRSLIWLGLTDAIRALHPTETLYTFWDYQAGAWPKNRGLRIDHALLSPRLAEQLTTTTIHRNEREKPQPSDHVPVTIELEP